MIKTPELEICCNNWQSAKIADEAGADRIELCTALEEGGITPSAGLILQCVQQLSLQVHVLIRPRGGDFLYNADEIEIMKKDIEFCKNNGVDGVVFGFLKPDGTINKFLTKEFIDFAHPMKVTFHRAFDRCKTPLQALNDLIDLQVDYLLTSGQKPSAIEGADLIKELVNLSKGRIKIMAASGVRTYLLPSLMLQSQAHAYHLSARVKIDSKMSFRENTVVKDNNELQSEYAIQTQKMEAIKEAKRILHRGEKKK